ncbi:E3 SUMO-protein ligase ZBED1-like [Engraulis encrasicolus]|uniref:E3 SUMO-protein ligase ZBED1-like n=1 Tax=Engraulis encrasicolus TaxID=184585 RepID=UPI002FD65B52
MKKQEFQLLYLEGTYTHTHTTPPPTHTHFGLSDVDLAGGRHFDLLLFDDHTDKNSRETKKMSIRKKSAIWNFFQQCGDTTLATCTTCKVPISFKGGSTANLHRHLKNKHPTLRLAEVRRVQEQPTLHQAQPEEEARAGERRQRSVAPPEQVPMTNFLHRPMNAVWQKNLDEKLVKMIASDLQPFSIVEDKGFREFTKALNPSYTLPGRKALSQSLIPERFVKCQAMVKERVAEAPAVCLTTDCWTSRTTSSYLAVTCHFVDDDFQMKSYLLDCFEFTERHTADNLAHQLTAIAEEWGVAEKVVACVTDNASNIKLAVRKTNWKHLSCFAHTLNLIVRGSLTVLDQTVESVKTIVAHFHKSTVAAEKLRTAQRQMGLAELKLIMDCPTRWNATLQMLRRFSEMREAIVTTMALVCPHLPTLSPNEWAGITEACQVLQPFEEVTIEISGERYVTASKIILLARGLQRMTANHLRSNHFKENMTLDLLRALTDQMANRFLRMEYHTLLSESSILDPRFKKKAFSDGQAAIEAVQRLTQAAAQVPIPGPQVGGAGEGSASADMSSASAEESLIWRDFDEQVSGLVSQGNSTAEATLELRSYTQEALLPRSQNPLTWWKTRQAIYPRLAVLMRQRLCITGTSVPSERVFSKMGSIISDRRSRLKPAKARQLVFLNANWQE